MKRVAIAVTLVALSSTASLAQQRSNSAAQQGIARTAFDQLDVETRQANLASAPGTAVPSSTLAPAVDESLVDGSAKTFRATGEANYQECRSAAEAVVLQRRDGKSGNPESVNHCIASARTVAERQFAKIRQLSRNVGAVDAAEKYKFGLLGALHGLAPLPEESDLLTYARRQHAPIEDLQIKAELMMLQ